MNSLLNISVIVSLILSTFLAGAPLNRATAGQHIPGGSLLAQEEYTPAPEETPAGETATPDPTGIPTDSPTSEVTETQTATITPDQTETPTTISTAQPIQTTPTEITTTPEVASTPSTTPDIIKPTQVIPPLIDWSPEMRLTPEADFAEPGKSFEVAWEITGDLPKGAVKDALSLAFVFPTSFTMEKVTEGAVTGMDETTINLEYRPIGKLEWQLAPDASGPFSIDLSLLYQDETIATTNLMVEEGFTGDIDISGGEVNYKNGKLKITLPADVVSEKTSLKYKKLTLGKEGIPYSLSGNMFELTAAGIDSRQEISRFNKELAIAIRYEPEQIPGDENTLTLFYYDELSYGWYPLRSEVDIENHILTGYSDHFTVFDFNTQDFQAATLPTLKNFQAGASTGAATYSYAIEVPPGPGGLQPSISLSYNSQAVDSMTNRTQSSWVGAGWSLNTGGYIIRNMNGTPGYWGSDDNYPPDGDSGEDGDDTFTLILNGQSWQMLRMSGSDPFVIDYRTIDENFMRIQRHHIFDVNDPLYAHRGDPDGYWSDWSWWEVWDKQGNIYYFGSKPVNNTQDHYKQARFCAKCGYNYNPYVESPLADTWKWGLSEVHTPFTASNPEYKLTYFYTFEDGAGKLPDCNLTQSDIDYAMYPSEILYPNGRYRIRFIKVQDRLDHQNNWQDPNSAMLFEKSRLTEIVVENYDGSGWVQVRRYVLSYVYNKVLPNIKWNDVGGKTPTLLSITEYNNNNSLSLPATTFTYDDMHLTSATNGYGGQVGFTYEKWHELESAEIPKGWWGGTTATGKVNIGTPAELFTPGQYNRMVITLQSYPGVVIKFGVNSTYAGETVLLETHPGGAPGSTNYKYEGYVLIPANASQAQFFHECTNKTCKNLELLVYPVVTRYRVTQKTDSASLGATSITTSYTYDGGAVNDTVHSVAAATSLPYVKKNTESRGNKSVRQVASDGAFSMTWFYQNDILTGRPYFKMDGKQTYAYEFNADNAGDWFYMHASGTQLYKNIEGDKALEMNNPINDWNNYIYRRNYSIVPGSDSNSAMINFKLTSAANDFAIRLENFETSNAYWGINTANGSINSYYSANGNYVSGPTLIDSNDFVLNTWYVLMFIADGANNQIRVWKRDDPNINEYYSFTSSYFTGVNWRLLAYVKNGTTAWLDSYLEGKVYSINQTNYQICDMTTGVGTDCPTAITTFSYPIKKDGPNYIAYTGFKPSWVPTIQEIQLIYNGDSDFDATLTTYNYSKTYQAGIQYGNVIRQYFARWNGSSFVSEKVDLSGYYPTISSFTYLVGLPAFLNIYKCPSGVCDEISANVIGQVVYFYDNHTSFSNPPTTGILTSTKSVLRKDASDNFFYSSEVYTNDSWGNRLTTTNYSGEVAGINGVATQGARTTTSTYDSTYHTYMLNQIDAMNHPATTFTYDYRMGVPLSMAVPLNIEGTAFAETNARYDTFGRLIMIWRPGDSEVSPTNTVSYNNNSNLFWTEATQKLDASTYYRVYKFYNGMGQLIQTQVLATLADNYCVDDPDINPDVCHIVVDYYYDSSGRQWKQSMPYAILKPTTPAYSTPSGAYFVTSAFDWFSRVNLVTQADGAHTHTTYNDLTVTTTDKRSESWVTTQTYDVWGILRSVTPPAGPGVTYGYDVMNDLTSAVYGTYTTSIVYDLGGRKTSMTDPDMGAWAYAYDALGNLVYQHDAKHQVTCLYYDNLNRLKGKKYQGDAACPTDPGIGYTVAYTYDTGTNGFGRRIGMTDSSGSSAWSYDSRGRLTQESKNISGSNYLTRWTYNSADLPFSMTYHDGEMVTNAYLPQMAVDSVTGTDSYVGTSRYDEAGRLIHREFGFGSSGHTDYAYNAWNYTQSSIPMGGRLNHVVSVDDSHTYQDNAYRYDANGNITFIDDDVNGFPQTQTFTYDAINRLLSAAVTGGSNGTYGESYTYNGTTGNLASNGSGTLTYGFGNHPHAVSALGTNSYTYDANGNMITRVIGGVTYTLTYDAENRLTGISGGSLTASYVYDGDGKRVRALVNDTWTNYLGNYYEATSSTITKYYYAGAQRVAWRVNTSSPYYGFSDHLGSTSVVVDVEGEVIGSQLYKAWGASRYVNGSLNTTFKYTGQREAENGLYFYNARWYDPILGRFAQADTIIPQPGNPLAWDRYAFVANNPIIYVDPGGHCWGVASGLRGVPTYATTCSNIDSALTIVRHPEASFSQKALAGGYIAAESVAHVGLAVGASMLACSTIAACAGTAEAYLGIGAKACGDGDCTNEISATYHAVDSVWKIDPFSRGRAIENMLGRSPELAQNYPVIDRFQQNGVITSIKSIDLMARSYQNPATLTRTITGYIDRLAAWNGSSWANYTIKANQITGRELQLAIPPNAQYSQMIILQLLQEYASDKGVNLIIQIIR